MSQPETPEEGLFGAVDRPNSDESAVFEDDGVVAYAYYWKAWEIVGYVWLYNHPNATEGVSRAKGGNAPVNIKQPQATFTPVEDVDEVAFVFGDRDGQHNAAVYIRGKLHAIVGVGDEPGRCVLAESDTAFARRL